MVTGALPGDPGICTKVWTHRSRPTVAYVVQYTSERHHPQDHSTGSQPLASAVAVTATAVVSTGARTRVVRCELAGTRCVVVPTRP